MFAGGRAKIRFGFCLFVVYNALVWCTTQYQVLGTVQKLRIDDGTSLTFVIRHKLCSALPPRT